MSRSDNSIAQPARITSQELHKNVKYSKSTDKTAFCSDENNLTSNEQNLPKASEEPAVDAVGRLRKKLQNLNSPGSVLVRIQTQSSKISP